ncbi:class I SAM-dependent methyltransferase [Spirochaeta cellobiosiphila]|uniref:class I SAM-dependent methyltransferase n=1 Tax=Spirochaeta cellobiosiphila TaxID=504483 RepID=UPI000420C2C0|nr:methyltransferase domain-containing protein [Spirochaeta cellobiosiphila]
MQKEKLLEYWKREETRVFQGWDFSSIRNHMTEGELPWNYHALAKQLILPDSKILDMGTGGGEFLLSLNPYAGNTFATESYLPNFNYSQKKLNESGINLSYIEEDKPFPYSDNFFDVILNRHESYDVNELKRVLKTGGIFVSQQVGGKNNLDFSIWLLGKDPGITDHSFNLSREVEKFESAGFTIIAKDEFFPVTSFTDVGAFVYFAKIIEWEFPGFTVNSYKDKLFELQKKILKNGYFELVEHRFMIKAMKD